MFDVPVIYARRECPYCHLFYRTDAACPEQCCWFCQTDTFRGLQSDQVESVLRKRRQASETRREKDRRWRAAHPEYHKQYDAAHDRTEYFRQYRETHREERNAYFRERRQR